MNPIPALTPHLKQLRLSGCQRSAHTGHGGVGVIRPLAS